MSGQWYSYADKHKGIRLQVSKELFDWHKLNTDIHNDGYGLKPYVGPEKSQYHQEASDDKSRSTN